MATTCKNSAVPLRTEITAPWQPLKVLQSGLICGTILFFLPQGEPWSGLSLYSGAVMGRVPNFESAGPSVLGTLAHFALALIYCVIVVPVARNWRVWRGVLVGCLMGTVCYALNWSLAHFFFPSYEGQEGWVMFTHLLYGLFVTAIYKGLSDERVHGIHQTP